ncbi:MAG: tetratricopeptide repeat protein [Alcanivoracaceae bacterium]|nr:tetratricopeptide repeat protein [Alcanivoracaceae bacterium]
MKSWHSHKICLLTASIAIAVAGCASQKATQQEVVNEARYSGTTLADLESTDITIEAQTLDNVSAENALESYRRAVELFQDPEKRSQSLRRMADLALAAAEEKSVNTESAQETKPANANRLVEQPNVSNEDLDRDVDKMLYENFMREAKATDNREEKYALLDLAGNVRSNLEGANLETDYSTAILLYKELLDTSTNPAERGEAYYLLAKAYALAGDLNSSRAALDSLVTEYPDSPFYTEAQFRRGELLFSEGDFEYSALAYREVVKVGTSNDFYGQAQYKLGWSEYKLGEYEKALTQFLALVDTLYGKSELDNPKTMEAKLYADTQRAVSLAFSNLDGATSVKRWFASKGHREYEKDVYRALGEVYLQQERFRDAAEAFEMFVTVYPDSAFAPEFSTLSIQAYDTGGFPTEVLPAKERFASRYGIRSTYWQSHPDVREGYVPLLKGHLLDLAKYYHSQAQRSKKPSDYDKPAAWYQEYLATPPAGPENVDINNLYAQSLFSAQHYAQAVTEFERTAYQYNTPANVEQTPEQLAQKNTLSSEAAYFALVAYQKHIATLPNKTEADKKQLTEWRNRRITSSLKFAATYPAHDKVPSVVYNVIEDQLANGDKEAAIKTAGVLVNRQPPPEEKLLVYGWATIANGEYDLNRFKVAEFGYTKLLQFPSVNAQDRKTYQERLAASVYKQGEELQTAGQLAAAAAMFMRVGDVYPDASIRKNAEFDAATIYLNLDQTDAAIPILESFRKRYPGDPLNETVPDKLALAYEKTGNFGAAALELETIASRYGSDDKENQELARQALWQAAEMQDRAKQPEDSIRLYKKYVQTYPQPYDFRAEAQYRLTGFYQETGNMENREYWLNQLIKTYNDAGNDGNDRVAWLAAWAAFSLAEPTYDEFASIKLTQPLKKSLTAKTTAMKDALGKYEKVAAIGVSEYATASNYKIGQMYRVLAKDMMESERPKGLNDLETEQYDLLLEEQALPYEDQAIDILIANTDLVKEDIYDKWVKQSFAELAQLLPGRYAKTEQVEDYVDIIY